MTNNEKATSTINLDVKISTSSAQPLDSIYDSMNKLLDPTQSIDYDGDQFTMTVTVI